MNDKVPVLRRFTRWSSSLVRGDLGRTIDNQAVNAEIGRRMWVSLRLVLLSAFVGPIWEWFDPLTLLRAVHRIRETYPEIKLFFMGVKHPNPLVPDMDMTARAMALADELGLTGSAV